MTNGVAANTDPKKEGRYLHKGYWWVSEVRNLSHHPYRVKSHAGMQEHRLVAEAHLNGMTLESWLEVIAKGKFKPKHRFIPPDQVVHHKDEDSTNNRPENLEIISRSEHALRHRRHVLFPVFHPKPVVVDSVAPDGEAEVFDLTVEEAHNFVANGIVVHNCGKTYVAKAAAGAVAQLHEGNGSRPGFMYKKGPEILDKYVGASEANIRALFAAARDHQEKHGVPAVIFLDEADAVLGKRGVMRGLEGMERTTVPQFLAEMDGLDDSGAFLIVATNRPDDLDPAVTRDGRIDRKIRVSRPGPEEIRKIVALNLRGRPIELSADELGSIVAGAVKIEPPLAEAKVVLPGSEAGKAENVPVELAHAVTGSMLAALCDRATRRAMKRAVGLSEERKKKAAGEVKVQGRDLLDALNDAVRELGRTDLWGALLELEHDTGGRIVGVERRKAT